MKWLEKEYSMTTIIGIKPMKSSEAVKIHCALDGHEPRGMAFNEVKEITQMESGRLRELLEKYHLYFTPVGDSDRFIINRHYYDGGSLYTMIDSIERRNVQVAIAKFTPFFVLGLILCSSTIGFMLSAIVNRHGGYF